jgi:hypothetical protein
MLGQRLEKGKTFEKKVFGITGIDVGLTLMVTKANDMLQSRL